MALFLIVIAESDTFLWWMWARKEFLFRLNAGEAEKAALGPHDHLPFSEWR
jgi:hypothetical protein